MTSELLQSVKTDSSYRTTQGVIILSTFLDLTLGCLKIGVGWIANSHALIADGIHSFSDLFTDLVVWVFNHIGRQAPDEEHPYGHARFETFGTVILGAVLLGVAGALIYDSIIRLMNLDSIAVPEWPALVAAAISFMIKEWLYQITRRVGEKTNSALLIANAWHHRSDSLSSVIVFVGVAGALMGAPWLEMVAAIGVAMMIAHIGWNLGSRSVEELVDTALSGEDMEQFKAAMVDVEGVTGIHSLRTRKMGNDVLLDIHIQVDPGISVSEGHHIGEWVTRALINKFPAISDIIFHIDAEDDTYLEERDSPLPMLPLRAEVRNALKEAWCDIEFADDNKKVTLHYLDEGINVEVYLDRKVLLTESHDASLFKAELIESSSKLEWITKISVWYG
ncbi:MAG: cation diffusion facilitator family transporter [Gammaproteobacteria bacterium]|nr:cation diffusion facilitator family transporter [Gammaproteobacteria bacterium]